MIERVDTVATQAMQLWLSPNLAGLEWPLPSTLVVNYESPGANWLDASQVIPFERLPSQIGSVAYFRSVLQDPPMIPADGPSTFPRISAAASSRPINAGSSSMPRTLWPALAGIAAGPPSSTGNCSTIRNRIAAPPAAPGWHYFRANVEPSDRFVLSSVDATRFRLRRIQGGANFILPATGRTTSSMAAVSRAR